MSTEGLLFQLEAKPGTEDELAATFDLRTGQEAHIGDRIA